jgi:hypothetical protein
MTHIGEIPESDGELSRATLVSRPCKPCGKITRHTRQTWESNDGAYEDFKFTCQTCSAVHWVDGIDS